MLMIIKYVDNGEMETIDLAQISVGQLERKQLNRPFEVLEYRPE